MKTTRTFTLLSLALLLLLAAPGLAAADEAGAVMTPVPPLAGDGDVEALFPEEGAADAQPASSCYGYCSVTITCTDPVRQKMTCYGFSDCDSGIDWVSCDGVIYTCNDCFQTGLRWCQFC